jgi:hypothetical protein
MPRIALAVQLSPEARRTLDKFVHSASTPQSLALRSRTVLAAADGSNNRRIAAALRVPPVTVGKWRQAFAVQGIEGHARRSVPDGLASMMQPSAIRFKRALCATFGRTAGQGKKAAGPRTDRKNRRHRFQLGPAAFPIRQRAGKYAQAIKSAKGDDMDHRVDCLKKS